MITRFRNAGLLAMLVMSASSGLAQAKPELNQFSLSATYEEWKLPNSEKMGMAEIGVRKQQGKYFNVGVGSYAAVRGNRGGFITLGGSAGIVYPVSENLGLEGGIYVGAGGGRGGFQLAGGGLMLREHLGINFRTARSGSFSLGVSRVDFPNGGVIHSNQVYLGYSLPFHALVDHDAFGKASGLEAEYDASLYHPSAHELMAFYRAYSFPASVRKISGLPQGRLGLLGAEWRSYLDDNWFTRLDAAGAMTGSNNGYMHILGGLGVRYPLFDELALVGTVSVGAGGGGDVNTGGGALAEASAGLQYRIDKNWLAELDLTYLRAPGTNLRGRGGAFRVGYQFGSNRARGEFDSHPVRIRFADQHYFKAASNWMTRAGQNVGNLGIQLDYFLTPQWFLTGQGLAAYSGMSGAYMTGQVGAGYHAPMTERSFVELEGTVGAAGGGGLGTGSGLIAQANLGYGYMLTKAANVMLTLGESKSINGGFRAHVLGVSLGYKANILAGGQ